MTHHANLVPMWSMLHMTVMSLVAVSAFVHEKSLSCI